MGLDTLRSRRDGAGLKWWCGLATLPEDGYPKQLFGRELDVEPHRGGGRGKCGVGWWMISLGLWILIKVDGWRILGMEMVHQLHLWLV